LRFRYLGLIPRTAQTEAYYCSMEQHAAEICRPSTEIDFHASMPNAFYPPGLGPAEFTSVLPGDWIEATIFAAMAYEAEQAGFDGVLIGTLQEPGLRLARTVVDIPIVGYGQAATLFGQALGRRHGVLAFNPPLFPLFRDRLNEHVPETVGPISDLDVTYAQLHAWFADPSADSELHGLIIGAAQRLVDEGADVVIPGQMLLAELVWRLKISRVSEAPVIDALGALVLFGESLCTLRRTSGLSVNRRGFDWAKAPAPVIEVLTTLTKHITG
jgi:allantoin racemase